MNIIQTNQTYRIVNIQPRRTQFMRLDSDPCESKTQVIAANFNYVFCMVSLNHNFKVNRLKRMLILVQFSKATPIIILTKSDLVDSITPYIKQIQQELKDILIYPTSVVNHTGFDQLTKYLQPENMILLIGSSGVGKSSLINEIVGQDVQKTGEIRSKDDRGKHTTTSRKIIFLQNGCKMIDTPGIRSFGLINMENAIKDYYHDIISLSLKCKFKNCKHLHETGCAVLKALKSGELAYQRYADYFSFLKESHRPFLAKRQHVKYNRAKFNKSIKIEEDDF